jgi:hypothetical protein
MHATKTFTKDPNTKQSPLTKEFTTISKTKCIICNQQFNAAVGLKIHVKEKIMTIYRTIKIFPLFFLFKRINIMCRNV